KVPFKVESQDEDVVVVVGTPPATPAEPATQAAGQVPPVDASMAGASAEPQTQVAPPAANTSPTYVPFTPVGASAPSGVQPANGSGDAGHPETADAPVAPTPSDGAPASTPSTPSADATAARPQAGAETASIAPVDAAEPEPMQVAAERPHHQAL